MASAKIATCCWCQMTSCATAANWHVISEDRHGEDKQIMTDVTSYVACYDANTVPALYRVAQLK